MSDTTAQDVKNALHGRYSKPSQGRPGERYVCIEEARSGAGFEGNNGQCDFLAINTWRSRGMELIGHEVKVSASDWKTELAKPEKAERFARYCCRWYVAAPSALASDIKHEVPPAWGLLSVSDAGRVTETVKPKAREPVEVPPWWWVGWLAQIDRQHKRRVPKLVREGLADEREKLRKAVERTAEQGRSRRDREALQVKANVDEVRAATGIDLRYAPKHQLNKLGEVWALARNVQSLDGLTENLRRAADALDAAVGVTAEVVDDVGHDNDEPEVG